MKGVRGRGGTCVSFQREEEDKNREGQKRASTESLLFFLCWVSGQDGRQLTRPRRRLWKDEEQKFSQRHQNFSGVRSLHLHR